MISTLYKQIYQMRADEASTSGNQDLHALRETGVVLQTSVITNAFGDCKTYSTADGQTYTSLVISLDALHKVMNGKRIVTTVSQLIVE